MRNLDLLIQGANSSAEVEPQPTEIFAGKNISVLWKGIGKRYDCGLDEISDCLRIHAAMLVQ